MSRLLWAGFWLLLVAAPAARAQDAVYVTTSNSGVLRSTGSTWSTFAPENGYQKLVPGSAGDFFAVRLDQIVHLDSTGAATTFATGVLDHSYGMARDGQDNYVVANGPNNSIQKFTPSGQGSILSNSPLFNGPFDLVYDSHGSLFISNTNNHNILKMDTGGNLSVFASGLNYPMGMIFDHSDNLYVVSNGANTIVKIDPAGQVTPFASTLPMTNPWATAFDTSGRLYLTSYWNDEVLRFDAAGGASSFGILPSHSVPYFVTVVPEPASVGVLAVPGLALLARRRR